MEFDRHIAGGHIAVEPINPNDLSPGEFAWNVRMAVERDRARVLIIDSLNGLKQAMATEQRLGSQLQELLHYLRQHGVLTLMTLAERGPLGDHCPSIEVCRQSDNVLRFHYFEAGGRVRTAMSMMKKRSGPHEHTLREFTLGPNGFTVGEPVEHFHGVLTGVPVFEGVGDEPALLSPAQG
jgi:circadian clock protein KaiC